MVGARQAGQAQAGQGKASARQGKAGVNFQASGGRRTRCKNKVKAKHRLAHPPPSLLVLCFSFF